MNTLYAVIVSFYILPKCVKTREPEDQQCVLQCSSVIHMQPYTPRHPQEPYSTAIHNMGAHLGFQN